MDPITIPILLTSSVIVHDTAVALSDREERIRLAIESVAEWLRLAPTLRLVLCDGSDFDFAPLVAQRFPGATIECLHFNNDQALVQLYGRGYGEGEIVRYALNHSRLIQECGAFTKCTSKLWVDNYLECLTHWNGIMRIKGVFLDVFSPLKPTRLAYIDTRFYISSCEAYRKYFENAHLDIRRDAGHGLEECFRDVVLTQRLEHILLPVPPVISGVGGGTGIYYVNTKRRILKEKLRVRLVRALPRYSRLF